MLCFLSCKDILFSNYAGCFKTIAPSTPQQTSQTPLHPPPRSPSPMPPCTLPGAPRGSPPKDSPLSPIGCSSRSGRCGRCRPCRDEYRRRRNALKPHVLKHSSLSSSNLTTHSSRPTRRRDSAACAWSCGYRPDACGNPPDPKPSQCPPGCTAQCVRSLNHQIVPVGILVLLQHCQRFRQFLLYFCHISTPCIGIISLFCFTNISVFCLSNISF